MADWFNITDSAVDPDAPLTSELGYAWRDNPIAIAEGAVGAPRIVNGALFPCAAGTAFTIATATDQTATTQVQAPGRRFLTLGCLADGVVTVTTTLTGVGAITAQRYRSSTGVSTAIAAGPGPVSFIYGDILRFNFFTTATGAGSATATVQSASMSPRIMVTYA